jgi:hypothetical protein
MPNPSYADLAGVKIAMGKFGASLTATSTPSESDVTNITLPDIAGIIDGVLSKQGLVTPATVPPSFIDNLRELNAVGAAARTVAALYPQAAGPASTTFHEWLQRLFDMGLDRLRNGEGIPDGVVMTSSGGMPRSFWTSHPDSASDEFVGTPGNDVDPVFTRDTKW